MLGNVASIAASGMNAAQVSLQAAASNVANLPTEGYRRIVARAEPLPSGGVRSQLERLPAPGVDLPTDLVEQKKAITAFAANLQVFKAADRMAGSWLDIRA
ncbi:flagellar hook-basal body protein [Tepidimonas alkaliphilus]|uniref:Flagellar hook-basal body protein n=1 Tax=Tepidimonas alkaliphilus TaxID=2588942 RepID=A0A554WBS6_9BURK|nr:flagellar basal body protein [Tepidimonas alkaliphilus]TSE21021.1 flagellar hook-basal body protein [Tepidimonas alkaliphilus]